jgi:hypothetical protein
LEHARGILQHAQRSKGRLMEQSIALVKELVDELRA